jgi:hypothetical protein
MSITRLCYRSTPNFANMALSLEEEIERITSRSRHNNKRDNVTGALILAGPSFFQIIEGPEAEVMAAYGRIARDTRHNQPTIIEVRTATSRILPDLPLFFCDALDAHDGVLSSLSMPIMQSPDLVTHDDIVSVTIFASARLSRGPEIGRRMSA